MQKSPGGSQKVEELRAVLFDAAGTLLHLREPVGETYARMASTAGVSVAADPLEAAFRDVFRRMPSMVFPGASPEGCRERERDWWRELVRRVFEAAVPGVPFADFAGFFDRLFRHFGEAEAWRVDHSVGTVLTALRGRGLHTGIVSNFDQRLHRLLVAFGLTPLLDVVVLPADAGAAKPDPRIFALALARLDVSAAQALYVGDDEDDDVAGATNAGLRAIDVATLPDLLALLR